MTSDTAAFGVPPPPPPPPPPRETQAGQGWLGRDLVLGSALAVLLVALFLPWFGVTVHVLGSHLVNGNLDGPSAHGYLWAVFALILVALIVLIGRDHWERLPVNLPSVRQVLVGATGLSLVLTVLALVLRPGQLGGAGQLKASGAVPLLLHLTLTVGWSYGGFIAVAAAAVAFVAALSDAVPLRPAGSGGPRRWSGSGRAAIRLPWKRSASGS